jgi:hypothetical protein
MIPRLNLASEIADKRPVILNPTTLLVPMWKSPVADSVARLTIGNPLLEYTGPEFPDTYRIELVSESEELASSATMAL